MQMTPEHPTQFMLLHSLGAARVITPWSSDSAAVLHHPQCSSSSSYLIVPAEIQRHGCRNKVLANGYGQNLKYAESVKIYSFGTATETETEIQSTFI